MKELVNVLRKYLHFIGIGVIALVFGLLFIPQFLRVDTLVVNGYEAIFYNEYIWNNITSAHSSVAGIIALILLVLACALFALSQKSSAAHLFAGVFMGISSLLFFFMQLWFDIIFRGVHSYSILWLSYVLASLLLIVAAFTIYTAILRLGEEKAAPVKSSTYSYLSKKK